MDDRKAVSCLKEQTLRRGARMMGNEKQQYYVEFFEPIKKSFHSIFL